MSDHTGEAERFKSSLRRRVAESGDAFEPKEVDLADERRKAEAVLAARYSTLPVYLCLESQPAALAEGQLKFYFNDVTTFRMILSQAASSLGVEQEELALKDAHGASWPPNRPIRKEVTTDGVPTLRITWASNTESEESDAAEEEVKVKKRIVDEGFSVRPPKVGELWLHTAYIFLLLLELLTSVSTSSMFELRDSIEKAFAKASISTDSSLNHNNAPIFRDLRNYADLLDWFRGPFVYGLTESDPTYGGSVVIHNRLVGGLQFESWQEPYAGVRYNQSMAEELRGGPINASAARVSGATLYETYNPWGLSTVTSQGIYSAGYDPEAVLSSAAESDAPGPNHPTYSRVVMAPTMTNLTRAVNGTWEEEAVPVITEASVKAVATQASATLYWPVDVWPDYVDGADPAIVWYLTNKLRVTFLLYNNNLNLYLWCEFVGSLNAAGIVDTRHELNAFEMDAPWSDFSSISKPWNRLSFLLSCVIYLLVLLRQRGELQTMRAVRRKTASYAPYFGSVYSWLELTNLACSWTFLALITYSYTIPERRDFDSNDLLSFRDMQLVSRLAQYSVAVRGICIITAAFCYFKFLALMPKTSTWYLTGTTLGRGGKDLKLIMAVGAIFLAAWATWAEQAFGAQAEAFSTWWSSYQALFRILSGESDVAKIIMRRNSTGLPSGPWQWALCFLYFFLFYFSFVFVLVPLCLAILRDAYAVRHDQLKELKGTIRREVEERAKERAALKEATRARLRVTAPNVAV